MDEKYRSRKFIVVLLILATTIVLAALGKMTGDVSNVLTALAVVYPAAQGYVDSRK